MTALRKLFVAALTLSLPVAALAQATPEAKPAPPPPPAVQLYGTLNVNLQYTEASDATVGSANDISPRFAVSTDSSNVGVRGTLKLTEGYSAVYQCETSANVDGQGPSGLCNRNSRIGLSSFWGTLAYGNWDTPFKAGTYGTKADDPFGNTDVYGFNGLMGSPGYAVRSAGINGTSPVGVASWDNRAANSVVYWSPKIAEILSFRLQWATNEFRTATGTVDPTLLGANVNVNMGPLSIVGSAEYHEDYFGIRVVNSGNGTTNNAASKDYAWRVAAGYDLPLGVGTLNVMGMFEQLIFKQDDAAGAGAASEYSRMAWLLGGKFRTGNHELRARYSQAMDPDITAVAGTISEDDLGAQNLALGYAYHLAKSTQAYLYYTTMMNDDNARYTFGVAGNASVVAMADAQRGADPMAIGIGMRHAF